MCAQYLIKAKLEELSRLYGIKVPVDGGFEDLVVPYRLAPVIVNDGEANKIKMMRFSLVPSWSQEPKVKFATHNARLETVTEKPTWRMPFESKRCLVPISSFVEPIYVKDFAGNMVKFFDKQKPLLSAAGIYDEWVDKNTGEVLSSFAILTSKPLPFVDEKGHDRSPVFLKEATFPAWLEPVKQKAADLFKLIEGGQEDLQLTAEIHRPLKPGWEKRR